jgi:hypothetical protein
MINRSELTKFFESKNKIGKGVEVGSYKGQYAKEILQNWKGKLFLVDVWFTQDEQEYNDISNQKNYKEIFSTCMDNIKSNENRCHMLRASSKNASELFEDESLDFVYIDANHKYDYVKEDIKLWYPKVRKGGIVSGHDYLKIDWYKDPNFDTNGKDKLIWMDTMEDLKSYNTFAGAFGVNPAVDEFCVKHNYTLNITEEWFGSWYIVK